MNTPTQHTHTCTDAHTHLFLHHLSTCTSYHTSQVSLSVGKCAIRKQYKQFVLQRLIKTIHGNTRSLKNNYFRWKTIEFDFNTFLVKIVSLQQYKLLCSNAHCLVAAMQIVYSSDANCSTASMQIVSQHQSMQNCFQQQYKIVSGSMQNCFQQQYKIVSGSMQNCFTAAVHIV